MPEDMNVAEAARWVQAYLRHADKEHASAIMDRMCEAGQRIGANRNTLAQAAISVLLLCAGGEQNPRMAMDGFCMALSSMVDLGEKHIKGSEG